MSHLSNWLFSFQNLKFIFCFLFLLVQIILPIIITLEALLLYSKRLLWFWFLNKLIFNIFQACFLEGDITYRSLRLLNYFSLLFKISIKTWKVWGLCFFFFHIIIFTVKYRLICNYFYISYFIIFCFYRIRIRVLKWY